MIVTTRRGGKETKLTIDRQALDAADSLEAFDQKAVIRTVPRGRNGTKIQLKGLLVSLDEDDSDVLREHLAVELPSAKNWRIVVNGSEASAEDIPGERYDIDEKIEGLGRLLRATADSPTQKRTVDVAPKSEQDLLDVTDAAGRDGRLNPCGQRAQQLDRVADLEAAIPRQVGAEAPLAVGQQFDRCNG